LLSPPQRYSPIPSITFISIYYELLRVVNKYHSLLWTFVFINDIFAKGSEIVNAFERDEMNKEKVNLLKWFVAFAYFEVDMLKTGDLMKLTAELHLLLANGLWRQDPFSETLQQAVELAGAMEKDISKPKYDQKAFERVKELQVWFRREFDIVMGKVDELHELEDLDKWNEVGRLPNTYSILPEICSTSLTPHLGFTFPKDTKERGNKFLVRGKRGWREECRFTVTSQFDPSEGMILLLFLRALNGVQTNAFRRCEECKKFFLHVSKRERRYCANPCAARKGNRDRRAAKKKNSPDKYKEELKSGAERARKSYVKKVRSKTPNAKIASRPRKF
jgi:hypothetical protein